MHCLKTHMSSKFEILFTAPAAYDLKKIKTYLDGLDPSIFMQILDELELKLALLEEHPFVSAVFLVRHGISYRRIVIKGYIIVYDVRKEDDKIYIDRVFHHTEDYYRKVY